MDARTQYIRIARFWTLSDHVNHQVEVQLEPRPDDDKVGDIPREQLTALQAFSRKSGDAISGSAIFTPDQLRELHEAIGKRLVELDELARQSS